MIHDLQQDVVDVRMRFFDFIEQQHAMRLFGDGFGEQSALVEAHITRRCADQARHRMPFHVFRHVETQQFDAQDKRQLAGDFGLAHARRPRKQEAADGLVGTPQPGTGHLDRGGQRSNGLILTEHHGLQVTFEGRKLVAVVGGDVLRRNAGNPGNRRLDFSRADEFFLA